MCVCVCFNSLIFNDAFSFIIISRHLMSSWHFCCYALHLRHSNLKPYVTDGFHPHTMRPALSLVVSGGGRQCERVMLWTVSREAPARAAAGTPYANSNKPQHTGNERESAGKLQAPGPFPCRTAPKITLLTVFNLHTTPSSPSRGSRNTVGQRDFQNLSLVFGF